MLPTYGMAIMEHRTSFSLDEATILRLKKLAGIWHVSQAEVVRRALEKADTESTADSGVTVRQLISYQTLGGISASSVDVWLNELSGRTP